MTAPPYDARTIANYFIRLSERKHAHLSVLALMKIVYFAHGYHLVRHKAPLISQDFEAWENGPVVRVLWDSLKHVTPAIPNGFCASRFLPHTGRFEPVPWTIDVETDHLLEAVFEELYRLHAFALVEMTHEPGSPWHEAWNANDRANLGMKIPNDAIRTWFSRPQITH